MVITLFIINCFQVVLLPSVDAIPWFATNTTEGLKYHQEYERNNCYDYYTNQDEAPEVCQKMYSSIAAYIFNGAFNCQCDPEGSESKFCKKSGGFCTCKPNVVGRRCDRCAPGTYGFGPDGCKACDCNSIGALDNFCNTTTGQCKCRANTYGRECNRCRNGFWNFPNCVRCDCNGHSDTCDPSTGACEVCKDNTEGHTCDRCKVGFYGDPRLNVDIPCRPCPCPGLGNHSFASSCSLDPYTKDVICDCQKEYTGISYTESFVYYYVSFFVLKFFLQVPDVMSALIITSVTLKFQEEIAKNAIATTK